MKVNVLGTEYTIIIKKYEEDKSFERDDCSGYCCGATRQIVVCDMSTYKGWENDPAEAVIGEQKKILRHEIVHAFFYESGLACNSNRLDDAWARNEERVDWFALQGPKIYKAWQEADAL